MSHTKPVYELCVRCDPKPIPIRCYDWEAVQENYEGGMPIGFGATRGAAIDDLLEQLEERAADDREEARIERERNREEMRDSSHYSGMSRYGEL